MVLGISTTAGRHNRACFTRELICYSAVHGSCAFDSPQSVLIPKKNNGLSSLASFMGNFLLKNLVLNDLFSPSFNEAAYFTMGKSIRKWEGCIYCKLYRLALLSCPSYSHITLLTLPITGHRCSWWSSADFYQPKVWWMASFWHRHEEKWVQKGSFSYLLGICTARKEKKILKKELKKYSAIAIWFVDAHIIAWPGLSPPVHLPSQERCDLRAFLRWHQSSQLHWQQRTVAPEQKNMANALPVLQSFCPYSYAT